MPPQPEFTWTQTLEHTGITRCPLLAILDSRPGWGALVASQMSRIAKDRAAILHVRNMDSLEALRSCLDDRELPVAILLAEDFDELDETIRFVFACSRRRHTLVMITTRRSEPAVNGLFREAGAYGVVENTRQALRLSGPLKRFFSSYW